MKNLFRNLFLCTLTVGLLFSCTEADNTIDQVLQFETGAVLRTIEVGNSVLNSSDNSSTFTVTLEEQDAEDGGLFAQVNVLVDLQDLTPGNGTTTTSKTLVKSVPASEFSPGPVGLPRGTVSVTFGEMVAALGLSPSDYDAGDVLRIETELELTDGRKFGAANVGSSTSGGFFRSPFSYNALLTCTPEPGDYRVEMHDSFGDGWQTNTGSGGDGITIDLGNGTVLEVGMCSPYGGSNVGTFLDESLGGCTGPASTSFYDATAIVTIPAGSPAANWNFPGDEYGEISFEVYGPDDSLLFESGGPGDTTAGLLPITFCLQL